MLTAASCMMLALQVSEDLDMERERFADLQRTYNSAVVRFEEMQQNAVHEHTSAAEAGLRTSLRALQERMRSMATEHSALQRMLAEKQERLELLSDSIMQLQRSLVDEETNSARLEDEVTHLRQQLASAISMPAPRTIHFDGDDQQQQMHRLRAEKQELEEQVRELQQRSGVQAHWEQQLRELESVQQETERMFSQVLCSARVRAAACNFDEFCSGERPHYVPAATAGAVTASPRRRPGVLMSRRPPPCAGVINVF